MGDLHGIEFPRLFRLWRGHDLADHGPEFGSYRHAFYEGLRREDEPVVWRFIEENYLRKYGDFVRVEHEWCAEGLWRIPFPGSVSLGEYRSPQDYGMPTRLAERVLAWQAAMDRLDLEEEYLPPPLAAEGLETAKEVKLFLGDGHYVEFHPFREIAVRDGEAVETEVPRFIADSAR